MVRAICRRERKRWQKESLHGVSGSVWGSERTIDRTGISIPARDVSGGHGPIWLPSPWYSRVI